MVHSYSLLLFHIYRMDFDTHIGSLWQQIASLGEILLWEYTQFVTEDTIPQNMNTFMDSMFRKDTKSDGYGNKDR